MSQSKSSDEVKAKVQQVKEIVTKQSNQNIILVLQYYENDVERAIQAFLEDGAQEALSQWHYSGNKPAPKKKKKNKNRNKESVANNKSKASDCVEDTAAGNQLTILTNGVVPKFEAICNGILPSPDSEHSLSPSVNHIPVIPTVPLPQHSITRLVADTHHVSIKEENAYSSIALSETKDQGLVTGANSLVTSISSESSSSQPVPQAGPVPSPGIIAAPSASAPDAATPAAIHAALPVKDRTVSSTMVDNPAPSRPKSLEGREKFNVGHHEKHEKPVTAPKNHPAAASLGTNVQHKAGLEKSMKDLQRQVSSLQRFQRCLSEACDNGQKRITQVFQEAHRALEDREVKLMYEMEQAKHHASELLRQRQAQAAELRRQVDKATSMRDPELHELRADIKHFASERKIDEEIGQTERFQCDITGLIETIEKFGQVVAVNHCYSQRRPSVASISSSILSDLTPLTTPSSTPATPLHPPLPAAHPLPPGAAKVLAQSDSLTRYEQTDLVKLIEEKKLMQEQQRGGGGRSGRHYNKPRTGNQSHRGGSHGPQGRAPPHVYVLDGPSGFPNRRYPYTTQYYYSRWQQQESPCTPPPTSKGPRGHGPRNWHPGPRTNWY